MGRVHRRQGCTTDHITRGDHNVPRIPDKPCAHPGCPKLVPRGKKYCDEHAPLHPLPSRSTSKLGYNKAWEKARRVYLAEHPLCVKCAERGVYTKATVVDHIIPHRGDRLLFWDKSNWQALCKYCHDKKTGDEDRYVVYTY